MSDVVLAAVGGALVAVTVVDSLWTVLWSGRGGGPLTTLVTHAVRRPMEWAAHDRRWLLSATGPVVLLGIIVAWVAGLLVGFTLLFQAWPDGIRNATTMEPASVVERVYFVGYTLFTLGMGDFVPSGNVARLLTLLMNAAGMFLITLSVTYVLPVVSASVSARAFASSALALGTTPESVIVDAWDGRQVRLDHQLRSLSSELSTLGQQHLAYPVLHLFHAAKPSSSAPLAVAVLEDVLTLLDGVDPVAAPELPARRQLRSSIEEYLTSRAAGAGDTRVPMLPPDRRRLLGAGIPLVGDQEAFDGRFTAREPQRRLVHGILVATRLDAPNGRTA